MAETSLSAMADDIEELANSIYLENQLGIGWRISDFDGDKKTRLFGYAEALRTFVDLHPPASVPNPSGINPTEFKVLIDPKPVEEVTKGGIIKPDMSTDKEKYATTEGTIVAVSPLAFSYATADEWAAAGGKPKVGQAVLYARYAGVRPKGRDGKEYVLLNDKDVCATIEE